MLIYKKTSTLAVRHVFDPKVMGTMAEVLVKDGVKSGGARHQELFLRSALPCAISRLWWLSSDAQNWL
jgi:hypothetical protein